MARPSPTLSLMITLVLFFVLSIADKTLIDTTCNRTSFPDDCISGLETDGKSMSADPTGLARIAVQTLGSKIQAVVPVVSEHVIKARDYAEWSKFAACKDFYSVTPGAVGSALKSLDEHEYGAAHAALLNVTSNVDGCRAFNLSEIAQQNDMVFRFTNVSITLVHLVS